MKAGRVLDMEVAKWVMGLKVIESSTGGSYKMVDSTPRYSTDPVAAVEVDANMMARDPATRMNYLNQLRDFREVTGETISVEYLEDSRSKDPLRICLAALRATGHAT